MVITPRDESGMALVKNAALKQFLAIFKTVCYGAFDDS